MTATRAEPGATVTYTWRLGGRVVDRDRRITVKRAWRGKRLTVTVAVTKAGRLPATRTLSYPRVRR